jgi:hypothetical protein
LSQSKTLPEAERLAALPRLPRDTGGPVFAEPWEAQAFALAVRLSEQGHFTWKEWAAALAHDAQMLLVQWDYMVQKFTPTTSHPAFRSAIFETLACSGLSPPDICPMRDQRRRSDSNEFAPKRGC